MLLLKRASNSRPGGQWSYDDYDVFDDDRHIGRITCGLTDFLYQRDRDYCIPLARFGYLDQFN